MSATGRSDTDAPAPSDVAARLRDAGFVRLVAAATGDAVAGAGLLATALAERGVPYQTSVVAVPDAAASGTDADVTVALGRPAEAADAAVGTGVGPVSADAYEVATELDAADPTLALAGIVASGRAPGSKLLGAAEEVGIERRPGIATPGVDPVDGLAHSTLVHTPFSGDVDAASEVLAGLSLPEQLDPDARQQLASFVALTVAGDEQATDPGADAVERFLRPHEAGPFGTVGGLGDVLDATARERPGLATLLALGDGDPEGALDVWRRHGRAAHAAVHEASTGRYDGLYVARCGGERPDGEVPVGTVARLLCEYRSPEPAVLVVAEGVAEARVAGDSTGSIPRVGEAMAAATAGADGDGAGTATRGRATFDCSPTEFVAAFREVV